MTFECFFANSICQSRKYDTFANAPLCPQLNDVRLDFGECTARQDEPFFREARRKIKEERVDFVVVISNLSVFMRSIRVVAFYDL